METLGPRISERNTSLLWEQLGSPKVSGRPQKPGLGREVPFGASLHEGEGAGAIFAIRTGAGQQKGRRISRSRRGSGHKPWRKVEERPGQAPTPEEGPGSPA